MKKIKSHETGQALILIALAAVGLFAFAALAIDGTRAFSNKRQAQNAADTAVLAASLEQIRTGGDFVAAEAAAKARAESNGYLNNGGDTIVDVDLCSDVIDRDAGGNEIPIPGDRDPVTNAEIPCEGLPAGLTTAQKAEFVRVKIISTIPTTFGRVIGRDTLTSAVQAVARASTGTSGATGSGSGYGITTLKQGCTVPPGLQFTGSGNRKIQGGVGDNSCFLNTGSGDFEITGNVQIHDALDDGGSASWTVGGNVWLNGYTKTGSGTWDVAGSFFSNAGFDVAGSAHYTFGSWSTVLPPDLRGSATASPWPAGTATATTPPIIPDPFASVLNPPPNPGNCLTISNSGSTNVTLNPGCYTSIDNSGSGNLTFNPGIYYISPGGINNGGTGNLTANGVMIYLEQGAFAMNGHGNFNVTPMTSGPYAGLSVYMDRNNFNSYSMTGSGSSNFTGTIYAPSSAVTITGSGGTLVVDAQILAYTAELTGSGNLELIYNPANNYNPFPADQPSIRPIQ